MQKVIIAQIAIQQGKENDFLKLAIEMVKTSNAETGCITYRLHKDLFNESNYLFYEEYIDSKAVDAHNNSTHFHQFIKDITPLITKEPIINIY
ncbi:putative quinol monooxygenase [Tenacibaculum caenipelagi]|uniref:Quinol monooxygenase YgiN n=1 Tax=Tenacibaculum caenipelagi TaxID=1325435 RepID=A0A4R6TGE1_9FLAO|nr:putative quinol monooxygenase [Tenacibaculum caenipelagi]TDQ27779.1 quinol monooxygenase YgiN [Tenacibaculum caenipelagi]